MKTISFSEANTSVEKALQQIDYIRATNDNLTSYQKEELLEMVRDLTRMSAALWRIGVLSSNEKDND